MISLARLGAPVLSLALLVSACSNDGERLETADTPDTTFEETTTTTEAPTTTTEAPPTTTPPTTAAPAPATTAKPRPTTTTTAKPVIPADHAAVTIVNDYPSAVIVTIQGVRHDVPKGGRKGPFAVKPKAVDGNDVISVERADDRTCGTGGASDFFSAGGTYEVKAYANGTSGCGSAVAGPGISGVVNPGNKSV